MRKVWITTTLFFIIIFAAWYTVIHFGKGLVINQPKSQILSPIEPSKTHKQYWSMNDQNIMLLGGSVEDNLFQLVEVEKHLNLLQSVGGNYVRNTMSSRDEGNLWPFDTNEEGLYDLNKWNETYWNRFENFLIACAGRGIVVQIELWATFDFYGNNWNINPFNPINNINYTAERVHLPTEIKTHPTWTENDFFWSIPSQKSNLKLLEFQQKYIDKVLSYSLQFGNILYCIDNETSVTSEWGKFWSIYIKKVAIENDKKIYTTEMWDPWDLSHVAHRETIDHPEIYDFVDISQNNHNTGDEHWNNGILTINQLIKNNMLRPLNNVKVYGNDGGRHQSTQNGIDSFIRNVLFGAASSRFHRPPSGQGLNDTAQHVIKSMRMLVEKCDFFNGLPANHILENRDLDEAFCRAIEGKEYILYFPDGGKINMKLPDSIAEISIEWLQIHEAKWTEKAILPTNNMKIQVETPDQGSWLAYLKIT